MSHNKLASTNEQPSSGQWLSHEAMLAFQAQIARSFHLMGSPLSSEEILASWPSTLMPPRRNHLDQALGHMVRNGKVRRIHAGPGKLEYDYLGVGKKTEAGNLTIDDLILRALEAAGQDLHAGEIQRFIPSSKLSLSDKSNLRVRLATLVDKGVIVRISGTRPQRYDLPGRFIESRQGFTPRRQALTSLKGPF